MQVEVEEIKAAYAVLDKINSVPFKDIIWFENNNRMDFTEEQKEEWSFTGLNNTEFVRMEVYKSYENELKE